ncbi:Fe-S cluster assembly ATPase SufC [Anaerococcus sp. AGMB00486]|uniref:Fe-S cluster assembly ATPase SufC n=2 Tax=Anaerococcus TaxID=165779 RepID=A0ABX2NAK8_9FIRM|nr:MULTISPECIES: Fe-S cluster assembly ATPase SufC [Anaerococcus]MDY3006916.1 Fe-S cluster assembly ATPase SufC [Anaerococcus porci]MSS78524.1 Fe-S cluster assembly ATPase SufC [Anaerococcus porci]NVF11752.1 Fe-S cluster assembly ATPase SufC [Anaerococcus faecalis]
MKELLKVENLHVSVDDTEILKGIDLKVNAGEVHVIMGSNGSGKSTLMNAIMANPIYDVTEGKIYFEGEDITDLTTDKRAKAGIFMSFQSPDAISGVRLGDFLKQAKEEVTGKKPSILGFNKELKKEMEELKLSEEYAYRYVNVGFSGGERKKSEILQLKILNPKLAMLDETDSGLDVDAVRIVSEGIKNYLSEDNAVIVVTHHNELLANIDVDYVHVLKDGKIKYTSDASLMEKIEKEGYEWV